MREGPSLLLKFGASCPRDAGADTWRFDPGPFSAIAISRYLRAERVDLKRYPTIAKAGFRVIPKSISILDFSSGWLTKCMFSYAGHPDVDELAGSTPDACIYNMVSSCVEGRFQDRFVCIFSTAKTKHFY